MSRELRTRLWLFKFAFVAKLLSQILHLYGRSPVCTCISSDVYEWFSLVNITSVCVCGRRTRVWTFRWTFWVNRLSHILHWKGRSPVCIRTCITRSLFWANLFLQYVHWWGRRPVWVRKCLFKRLFFENDFMHTAQVYSSILTWKVPTRKLCLKGELNSVSEWYFRASCLKQTQINVRLCRSRVDLSGKCCKHMEHTW